MITNPDSLMVRCCLCWLLVMASPASTAVSLVLRDGTVLDYGNPAFTDQPAGAMINRRFVPGDPEIRRIALPEHAMGIHRVLVDGVARRVYVIPQLPIGRHGTQILDQDSLRPIGFLPGIVEVVVPRHPNAKHVIVQRAIIEDAEAVDQLRDTAAETPAEAVGTFPIRFEQISRAHPERLAPAREVEPGTILMACERIRGRGYPGGTRVDTYYGGDQEKTRSAGRRDNVDAPG
ncbi:MAG: hypothetical protein IPK97_18190 [Ahniella sp.]|nr:hypothetical protein [Ahniella sp.]